jgi:hypothetical protein
VVSIGTCRLALLHPASSNSLLSYREKILQKGIRECDILVAIISTTYDQSEW